MLLEQLLTDYPAAQGNFDEMRDEAGETRAHWRTFLEYLSRETPNEMRQRIDNVRRRLRNNGVTYNVYDDASGVHRPWDLNVLPLILPHDEWAEIEAAVTQRATLLNRILLDMYGEQKLLEEGLLPPALIHGNAGFLRPCHDIAHRDGIAMHFYAVDMARAPNGQWWVVADRTQAPSGAGYALENRSIISRAFPDLFRDLKVQHLAGFFSTMRDSLAHWGRLCAANQYGDELGLPLREDEQPLIVLLTPGPYNETYYEQTFLAKYLGFPLVEGSDLTVRNGMVWYKTLSGLQRVHVILRRVDDDFCDPLELRTDSVLGVAGLIEAARRGNVLIANSLGSNLLSSGALLGFLPTLCQRLLDEPLKMPSVGTWWCGEPLALEQVIENLDRLIIKPSFPQLQNMPVFGQDLKDEARDAFIASLRAEPQNFVAQDLVQLSQAPVWKSDKKPGLDASAIGLRVYACATPDGYVVMPGGLTRVATGPDARVLTMQRGGGSKDTWVQGTASTPMLNMRQLAVSNEDLLREDTRLSSRLTENLYWFGRYTERCMTVSRLIRTTLDFMLNTQPEHRGKEWPVIQGLCKSFGLIESIPEEQSQTQSQGQSQSQSQKTEELLSDAEVEAALVLAVISTDLPGPASYLEQLYRIGSQLRERLSQDNWRILNRMIERPDSSAPPSLAEAGVILDETITSLMTLAGFATDGMTRDNSWRFLSIGRRIERLQFQCVILQHALQMNSGSYLDWLLELSDSSVTYRSRYKARPEWVRTLDLLLLDETNPRSVMFQLQGIVKYQEKLSVTYGYCGERLLTPVMKELSALSPRTDLRSGNLELVDLLARINLASYEVSEQLGLRFFSYTGDMRGDVRGDNMDEEQAA